MGTIPPTFSARDNGEQVIQYLRFRFPFSDLAAFAAGKKVGRLPANAFIHSVMFYKTTAFNSETTDTLALGTAQGGAQILAATTIASSGFANNTSAAGLGTAVTASGEVDVWAKYAQTGDAATAGDVTVLIAYATDHG